MAWDDADCDLDLGCTLPPPAGADPACRQNPEPGVFVYRAQECWEQWHPSNPFGATVDFAREMVATVCTWRTAEESVVVGGINGCGADVEVDVDHFGYCPPGPGIIDCAYWSFGVVLPNSVDAVGATIAETQLPLVVVRADGAVECIEVAPPECGDPADPSNDACWRTSARIRIVSWSRRAAAGALGADGGRPSAPMRPHVGREATRPAPTAATRRTSATTALPGMPGRGRPA